MANGENSAARSNGYDSEELRSIVSRIESCFVELLSERGAYMKRCRGIREGITAAYDEATSKGFKKKVLKKLIKTRELERKISESVLEMDKDEQESYDLMVTALGDFGNTPLGNAALSRAKPHGLTGEVLDELMR